VSLHVAVAGWLLGPTSGANRRLLALLRALGPQLAADERVTVLHGPDFTPPSLPRIDWQPIAIPAGPTLRRVRAERRLLPRALRQLGANVLDHGFLPLPPAPIPVCLLVHDLRAVDGLTRWPRWLARATLRSALAGAAAVVAPSRWTASRLRALAPSAAAPVVVANAVDAPDDGRDGDATLTAAADQPPTGFVLHVGHVEPRKNLGVVVAALAGLPPTQRPEFWLAGRDAGALAALQRAAAGTVALRALGVVDDDRLAALYRGARAVVLPSRHEGFGLPALEALAHGRPVLASACGALPEVVGAAGVLLPADDVGSWRRALANLPPDDAAARATRRAHATTVTWDASAAALLATWRRIAAEI
jgi:glycosyltransferase involved in cell wall biosynthesis